tara:strand:- start:30568 stop:31962 length:1395 start_codon:yes stop_codon:yes gene_type:complete
VEFLLDDVFIDPISGKLLTESKVGEFLECEGIRVPFKDGVVDFYGRMTQSAAPFSEKPNNHDEIIGAQTTVNTGDCPPDEVIDSAPELRAAHEHAFEATKESGGNIYGSLADAASITQSGHEARMRLLNEIELGDLSDKTVVDFGTGPWSFAAIFDKLRAGGLCIGFDVSATALQYAWNGTSEVCRSRTVYATSDGEVIPLADNSVDIFFGGEVIEHVRNPLQFMQEIARVCKDGAAIILTTPNKDAFAYRVHGLQYCVGPEHIALLSHEEFHDILSAFSTDIQIFGYETSIGPSEDGFPTDQSLLKIFQTRSKHFPELATGLVSVSRIKKSLYLKNAQSLRLKETINTDPRLHYSFERQSMTLFGSVVGTLLNKELPLEIQTKGRIISLLFWGHDWSGEVEITCGTVSLTQNLYSKYGGFIRVDINNDSLSNTLSIQAKGTKDPRSYDCQVIFYKLIEYIDVA